MLANLSIDLRYLAEKPIDFHYPLPSTVDVEHLKAQAGSCVVGIEANVKPINSYRAQGFAGTHPDMFARQSVGVRVSQIARKIEAVGGLILFDTYRSITTQAALFVWMCDQVRTKNPTWTDEQIRREARRYATDPNYRGRFAIPPHNSGGAIDLAIYDGESGNMLFFGSDFDEASERSRTDFYEAEFDARIGVSKQEWLAARHNRRVLFNLMHEAGFTNYVDEWWHYDLGDCMWAEIHGIDWYYESMASCLPSFTIPVAESLATHAG